MEPKFELRYYSDRKALTEFYRKIAIPFWLPMTIIIGVCVLYVAGVTALCCLLDPTELSEMLLPLFAMMVFGAVVFFLPEWTVWNVMRQVKEQSGGVEPEMVVTVGDTIEASAGITCSTIEFHRIIKVRRLKHSYVLMITRRSGILLRPDCFTKGSFEEFKQYLRQQCPNLFIPA